MGRSFSNASQSRRTSHRRWLWAVVCIAIAVLPTAAVSAQQIAAERLHSPSAILMDAHTGQVLFEKNAFEVRPPASVTKMVTLLLAMEAINEGRLAMDDTVTASARASSMGGTQVWLETGEQMSVRDLLHAIAIGSANDAAVAIAEHLAGSEPAFAELMNRRARELGARNTHFSNASGLPPEDVGMADQPHVTTAYDLAVVARYAVTVPGYLDLVSQYGPYQIRPDRSNRVELWNLNRMLRTYPGMDGIKTGMTRAAGYCLAATAVRGDLRLIAVVLGASTREQRAADVRTLLDWGFSRYEARPVVRRGEEIGVAPVRKGALEGAPAVAAQDLVVTVPRGFSGELQTRVEWAPAPLAPVSEGQPLGRLVVLRDGELISSVDIVSGRSIPRAPATILIVRAVRNLMGSLTPR